MHCDDVLVAIVILLRQGLLFQTMLRIWSSNFLYSCYTIIKKKFVVLGLSATLGTGFHRFQG